MGNGILAVLAIGSGFLIFCLTRGQKMREENRVWPELFWYTGGLIPLTTITVVWTAMENQAVPQRILLAALGAALGGIGLYALGEYLRPLHPAGAQPKSSAEASRPANSATPAVQRPTLEATNRSKIDATDAQFPSDLGFPFARADNDSLIDMPGIKVTKNPDGSTTVSPGSNVIRQFPPPTGEFSHLTMAELNARVLETVAALRNINDEQVAAFNEIFEKYRSRDIGKPPPDEMQADWMKVFERYKPTNERYAKLAQSIASECMVHIGSIDGTSMSPAARSGAGLVLHAKFAGPQPAFEAAEFLEALSGKLSNLN